MPAPITPQDQWETDFEGPLPGEPGIASAFRTLIQRILNRTERLKNRLGAILGLPWDATPPDTLAGLAGRVGTLESNQGSTTLSAHRNAATLDHPDGSVTAEKLSDGAVTTSKIANQSVTAAKLVPGSVVDHLGYTPLNKAGDTMTGPLFVPQITTNAGTGASGNRHIEFKTSSVRWAMGLGGDEGSNNVGADFYLWRYDNAGNFLGEIFKAERNSGRLVFPEISGRYDHQNRFVVSAFAGQDITVNANGFTVLGRIFVTVPSGRSLYVRRVRAYFTGDFRAGVSATTNVWTAGQAELDADINQSVLTGPASELVVIRADNVSSSNQTLLRGHGAMVEMEIR